VLARGYGLQDVENNVPVQPDSMFRIASNSKQITAVAIMKLIEAPTVAELYTAHPARPRQYESAQFGAKRRISS
jgi:Beta-lactamase